MPSARTQSRTTVVNGRSRKTDGHAEVDAAGRPVSEEEAEDIVTEAMRSVRPGYRPHQ